MHLAIGADGDGIAHRFQEGLAAVCIGIARRIICMRADVNIDPSLSKRLFAASEAAPSRA